MNLVRRRIRNRKRPFRWVSTIINRSSLLLCHFSIEVTSTVTHHSRCSVELPH